MLQKQVAVGAAKVLHFKTLDLDFFDQALVVCIQRIQHIHKVVLDCMGGRVVQDEQRIEVFQRLLRHSTAHFLGLVQNQDRPIGLDNINGPSGGKLIPFGVDNTCFLAFAVLFHR